MESHPSEAVNRPGLLSSEMVLPFAAMVIILVIAGFVIFVPGTISENLTGFIIVTIAGLGGYVSKNRQDFKNKLAGLGKADADK